MKKLDQFILKSFTGPFFGILVVVIFIFMLQFLWVYIDELVGKGLGLKVIMEFMGWGTCTMLPITLPLATLLASALTIGNLAENSELIAMKAAGISLARVMLPLTIVAALISVGAFFASNNLVPVAYNEIYTLRDDIGKTKSEINIPTGTFYDGIEGYILHIRSRDKKSGMMYDVMVYDHTGEKGNTSLTLADSALLKMSKAKDYLTFNLYSGINYVEDNSMSYRDTNLTVSKTDFQEQALIIPLNNYAFRKSSGNRFSEQTKAMNLGRLTHGRDSLTQRLDSTLREQRAKNINTAPVNYRRQLDTSFSIEGRSDMVYPVSGQWRDQNDEVRAYQNAVATAREMEDKMEFNKEEQEQDAWLLRRVDTEIFAKFAKAFACFILFLIGAPLGASINKKGGVGSAAIIAVLFFVLYWVVDITGVKLAKDGAITAAAGVFLSTAVLLPIGITLTTRAIKDKSIFNMDGFKTWWRKFISKVKSMYRKKKIVYFGTPEFAVAPLKALVEAKYDVVGVVTVADKPVGRGQKISESPVKKYAVSQGIPVLQPLKLKDPEFLSSLAALKADLFVVVAFRILPEEVFTMPPLGTFNLHAALLPQYRGAAPINWAVINGERMSGVTTFMIDKNIDTGGIILRQECRISETDTAGDLHDKLMPLGADLVLQTTEGIFEKNVETRVQRSFIQGSEILHPAPKLTRELCDIDWNAPTKEVYNLIRGLSPYPAAFTRIVKEGSEPVELKIYNSVKMGPDEVPGSANAAPGTIFSDGKSYMAIATADGAISLTDVQLAGKKRMDIKAFLAGFREPTSWKALCGTSHGEIMKTRPQKA
jgi:methionyl-tRNA formyltransferase